jgi:ubiquinone/menaquinone biosynthesis C-methylase UbiE
MGENYERYFVPAIFQPWATDLLDLVAPREGDRVLDVACATGIVARLASMRVGVSARVVGLDFNPVMLAAARSVAPAGASIEWEQANAENMPFPDESFDLVLCQQGLQFFPNKPVPLREMNRVLAPGGRVALSVWCDIHDIPGYIALADALAHHVSPEAAGFMHMTGSLRPAELRVSWKRLTFKTSLFAHNRRTFALNRLKPLSGRWCRPPRWRGCHRSIKPMSRPG